MNPSGSGVELLGCPFCGGDDAFFKPMVAGLTIVVCGDCGMRSALGDQEQLAEAWNRRAPQPSLDGEVREKAIEAAARAYHVHDFSRQATWVTGEKPAPFDQLLPEVKAHHRSHVTPIADAILALLGNAPPQQRNPQGAKP